MSTYLVHWEPRLGALSMSSLSTPAFLAVLIKTLWLARFPDPFTSGLVNDTQSAPSDFAGIPVHAMMGASADLTRFLC